MARDEGKLSQLATEVKNEHGCRVIVITKDLSQPSAPGEVYEAVKAAEIEVDYLINNAGFGGRVAFYEWRWEDDLSMIQLNVVALTALSGSSFPGSWQERAGKSSTSPRRRP